MKAFSAIACVVALCAAAPAPEPAGARAFVDGVYAGYAHSGRFNWMNPTFFESALYKLIKRDHDEAAKSGEIGLLDHDPLCGCQDNNGYRPRILSVTGDGAKAIVTITTASGSQRLALTHIGTGWRIADIQTEDLPSLKSFLTRAYPPR